MLTQDQMALLSLTWTHRLKQWNAAGLFKYSQHVFLKARTFIVRLDFGMNLGLESLNFQCCSNCRERCCWVKNWEGWAEIRKISRWVWGLWEGFWLWLEMGEWGGKSRGVKSFDFVILLLGIEDQNRGRASDMWLSLHFLRKLMFFTFTVLIRSTAMKT